MPETNPQFERRVLLYESVKGAVAAVSTVGSDQFVYWEPANVLKRFAPDLFVKLGAPHAPFDVWKVWERGAPELGVEIVSKSDRPEDEWGEKLARYRAAGIREVVRFDAADVEHPIRIWDSVDGELVERAADDPEMCACQALGLWWVLGSEPQLGVTLRLARDKAGVDLLPTPAELHARAERERAAAEQERAAEVEARTKAEEARTKAEQERAAEAEARTKAEQARTKAEQERAAEAEARTKAEQERDALRRELEELRAKAAPTASPPRKKAAVRRKK